MKATLSDPRVFEFYFPEVDTHVQVADAADAVVIRATRNSFSEHHRVLFLRWLAAEGFIPDGCHWLPPAGSPAGAGVRWLVDYSWLELPAAALAATNRWMVRLLVGGAVLWFTLMLSLFLR